MAKPSGGVCDTRCQLFNKEITKNENSLRMKWFVKNHQRLLDNLGSQKLMSKAQALLASHEEKRRRQYQEERANVRVTSVLPTWRPPNLDDSINLNRMRPVDSAIQAILYEAGVKSYVTADNYLRERYKEIPDNRFYFPECTNWVYGWRIKDHPPVSATKIGRRSIIQGDFYRRNASSLQRDPDWYRICQTGNPKNFNDILTY